MIFHILFYLIITLIVGYGCVLIAKSINNTKQQKIYSIAIILTLFFILIVVNILKSFYQVKIPILDPSSSTFKGIFFRSQYTQLQNLYELPKLDNTQYLINQNFIPIAHRDAEHVYAIHRPNLQFQLIVSQKNEGASYTLKEFVKKNHNNKIPTLFLKLKEEVITQEALLKLIGVEKIEDFIQLVEQYNNKKVFPYIIIDNIENSFTKQQRQNADSKSNVLISFLINLFQNYEVNVILMTDNYFNADILLENRDLRRIIDIKSYIGHNESAYIQYFDQKINPYIKNQSNHINPQNYAYLKENVGINWKIISLYYHGQAKYDTGLQNFTESILKQVKEEIMQNYSDYYQFLQKINEKYNQSFIEGNIHISLIKNLNIKDWWKLIEKFEELGFIQINRGLIEFKNKIHLNCIIKNFTEIEQPPLKENQQFLNINTTQITNETIPANAIEPPIINNTVSSENINATIS